MQARPYSAASQLCATCNAILQIFFCGGINKLSDGQHGGRDPLTGSSIE